MRRENDWPSRNKIPTIVIFTQRDELGVFSEEGKSSGWLEMLLFSEKAKQLPTGLEGLGPSTGGFASFLLLIQTASESRHLEQQRA